MKYAARDVWVKTRDIGAWMKRVEHRLRQLSRFMVGIEGGGEGATEPFGMCPVGAIVAWDDEVEKIPPGWALCDGTNGTPDWRDRFPVGAGGAYAPGEVGGEDASDLRHEHDPGTYTTDDDSHRHSIVSGYTGYANSHVHGDGTLVAGASDGILVNVAAGPDIWIRRNDHGHPITGDTDTQASHRHNNGDLTTDYDNHGHSVTAGESATGGSATQENRPRFRATYWIKRIY